MTHPVTLGAQVRRVMGTGHHAKPFDSHNLDPIVTHGVDLHRVVRQQSYRCRAEVSEDCCAGCILTRVDGKAQLSLRIDGVKTIVLQGIGLQLGILFDLFETGLGQGLGLDAALDLDRLQVDIDLPLLSQLLLDSGYPASSTNKS